VIFPLAAGFNSHPQLFIVIPSFAEIIFHFLFFSYKRKRESYPRRNEDGDTSPPWVAGSIQFPAKMTRGWKFHSKLSQLEKLKEAINSGLVIVKYASNQKILI
jgi:hypothetical protein